MAYSIIRVCHALGKTEAEVKALPVDEFYRHIVFLNDEAKKNVRQKR